MLSDSSLSFRGNTIQQNTRVRILGPGASGTPWSSISIVEQLVKEDLDFDGVSLLADVEALRRAKAIAPARTFMDVPAEEV